LEILMSRQDSADGWVRRQAAKYTTPESIRRQIAREREQIRILTDSGLGDFGRALEFHHELIRALAERLKSVTTNVPSDLECSVGVIGQGRTRMRLSRMAEATELVTAVLDDLLWSGILKSWSKAMRCIPGDDATRTIDVYEITFGRQADAEDRQGLEAFLQQNGQTGHGHEVEVRVSGQDGTPGTLPS
jgi:hypothetical protein